MVSESSGEIDCPGDCSGTYTEGELERLLGTCNTGYTNPNWSGSGNLNAGAYEVSMDADATAIMGCEPKTYGLTLNKPQNGTFYADGIVCGAKGNDCTEPISYGQTVTITGIPISGYAMPIFTGDCLGTVCDFVVDGDAQVSGVFGKKSTILSFMPGTLSAARQGNK